MFSWYKYLIVNFVFFHLGFWSGNLFLIVPFPDLRLLVLFKLFPLPPPYGRSSLTNEKDHRYFLNRFECIGEFFDG